MDSFVFLHVRPCAFFTSYCPTCEKTRFNDKFSLRQVLCSNLLIKKRMHEYCLQCSWFTFFWKLKNAEFGQYNNADEMKKKVFSKPLFFFFWEGRGDGGCRYWICGKEQKYHSSWLKRTKTLTWFIEVDFIITMIY